MLESLQILNANFPTDSTPNIHLIASDDENENLQVTKDRQPLPQQTVTSKQKQTLTNKQQQQPLTNRLQPLTTKQRPQLTNLQNQLLPIRQQSPMAGTEQELFTDRQRLPAVGTDKNLRRQLSFVDIYTDQHPLTNRQRLSLGGNNRRQPLKITQRPPLTDGQRQHPTER